MGLKAAVKGLYFTVKREFEGANRIDGITENHLYRTNVIIQSMLQKLKQAGKVGGRLDQPSLLFSDDYFALNSTIIYNLGCTVMTSHRRLFYVTAR